MSRVLFVVGMHRSGTSAVAGTLAHLGLFPGRARDLMQANAFNPNGYWEHMGVVSLNDAALAPIGGWSSTEPYSPPDALPGLMQLHARQAVLQELRLGADGAPLVVKDPRLCRLLPGWLDAARKVGLEPAVLLVRRERGAVVDSLVRRERMDREWAERLIDVYSADAFAVLEGDDPVPHVAVDFKDVLADWRYTLGGALSILLPGFTWGMAEDAAADVFLTGGRRSA